MLDKVVVLAGLLLAPLTASRLAAAEEPAMLIVDFGRDIQTAQGGFFRCVGGGPDQIVDRLTVVGEPAIEAWHLQLRTDAPADGIGALIPLFDETKTSHKHSIRLSHQRQLCLRIIGNLGERRLRCAMILANNPESAGTTLGVIQPAQLDALHWREVRLPLSSLRANDKQVRFIRITAEGPGEAWFAIDAMGVSPDGLPLVVSEATQQEVHSLDSALWVWQTEEILAERRRVEQLLDFCSQEGITVLFCQLPYSYDRGIARLRLADKQRRFLEAASAQGIAIHALDGAPHYVLPENHARMRQVLETLARFNEDGAPTQRYLALHLDNEPYLLEGWHDESQQRDILANYIALNRNLSDRANEVGLEFGVDIPFWWDERRPKGQPKYTFNSVGGAHSVLEALFPLVQNVGVMSYRDRVTGPNGVVRHCQDEFELGVQHGVDVFAAVELGTGKDVEARTSLGAYSTEYFVGQLETLERVVPFHLTHELISLYMFSSSFHAAPRTPWRCMQFSMPLWSTTSKAFEVSMKVMCSSLFVSFASAISSVMINAAQVGEFPLVKPNWEQHWTGSSFDLMFCSRCFSMILPTIEVMVIRR